MGLSIKGIILRNSRGNYRARIQESAQSKATDLRHSPPVVVLTIRYGHFCSHIAQICVPLRSLFAPDAQKPCVRRKSADLGCFDSDFGMEFLLDLAQASAEPDGSAPASDRPGRSSP